MVCGDVCDDKRKATTHQASHFQDPSYNLETFPCQHCNRVFATQKALSSHVRQCKNVATTTATAPPQLAPVVEVDERQEVVVDTAADDPPTAAAAAAEAVPDDLLFFDAMEDIDNVSFCTIDDVEDKTYSVRADDIELENCDDWMKKLLPPKSKPKKSQNWQAKFSSKMSAMELQRFYSKDVKKALKRIEFTPDISCEVDSVDLRYGLLMQLSSSKKNAAADVDGLWTPCCEGRSELSRRFTAGEISAALQYKNSAPGPDGWRYSDVGKKKKFADAFVQGLHWMAANGVTPESWKEYNSMMLFKKPDVFEPGQEKVMKNFRPIALSNVSYKLLASTLCVFTESSVWSAWCE